MNNIRVLIASPPALSRLIQRLLEDEPGFEVVGTVNGYRALLRRAPLLGPELIIASVKPVSNNIRAAVLGIKQASPASKLVLVCPVQDLVSSALRHGADACVSQEDLVGHLLPAARSATEIFPRHETAPAGSLRQSVACKSI